MEILTKIANGEEKIDMERIQTVIHRRKLDTLSSVSIWLASVESFLSVKNYSHDWKNRF